MNDTENLEFGYDEIHSKFAPIADPTVVINLTNPSNISNRVGQMHRLKQLPYCQLDHYLLFVDKRKS